jgi:hypothetical protein
MSPKKITRLGLIVGGVSLLGGPLMLLAQPEWGWLGWWPVLGLLLALLLFITAFLKGAYLAAQRRVEMVDMLNDCYSGKPEGVK